MIFTQTAAVSIPVRHFDKCLAFYSEALGMGVTTKADDKSFAALRAGPEMDIWLIAEKSFNQNFHAGNDAGPVLAVTDIEKTVNQLAGKGIHPVGNVVVWPNSSRHVTYRDPDGNMVTLFQRGNN